MKFPALPLSLLIFIQTTISSSPFPAADAEIPLSTGVVLRANIAIHTSGSCDPTTGLTIHFTSVPPSTCVFASNEHSHNAAMSVTGSIFGYAGANNFVSGHRWPNCWQEILRYSYPRNPHCLVIPPQFRAVSYNWTFAGYKDYEEIKLTHLNGETPKKWPDSFGRQIPTNWRRDVVFGPPHDWRDGDGEELEGRDRIPFDDFDNLPVAGWTPPKRCRGPDYVEYHDVDAGTMRRIKIGDIGPVPFTEHLKTLMKLWDEKKWKELGNFAEQLES